jgi:hypothetical protein
MNDKRERTRLIKIKSLVGSVMIDAKFCREDYSLISHNCDWEEVGKLKCTEQYNHNST